MLCVIGYEIIGYVLLAMRLMRLCDVISSACKPRERAGGSDNKIIPEFEVNRVLEHLSGANNQQKHNQSFTMCNIAKSCPPPLHRFWFIHFRTSVHGISSWYASPDTAPWPSRSWPGILAVPVHTFPALTSPPSTTLIVITSGRALHVHGPTISELTFSRASTVFVYKNSPPVFIIEPIRQTSVYLIV